MKIAYNFIFLLIIILTLSCSKKEEKVTILKEKNLETQMIEVYNQALKEFERGDVIYAGKKLSEGLTDGIYSTIAQLNASSSTLQTNIDNVNTDNILEDDLTIIGLGK